MKRLTDQQYRNRVADELEEYAKHVHGVLVAASMRDAAHLLRTPVKPKRAKSVTR